MNVMQQLSQLQEQMGRLQQLQQVLSGGAVPQVPTVAVQAPKPVIPDPKALLFELYDEFIATDEGKQLAESLEKFSQFAQSRVAKPEA